MNHSKINVGSSGVAEGEVLLQIDPVFLYNIPNKSIEDGFHRASEWNISAPDWRGKLLVINTGTRAGAGEDCCQVQFTNSDGVLFGGAVITKSDLSSSRAFQKVRDSSRYCTQQIQNTVSGDSAVYGVGFLNSEHISQLFHCFQQYFGPGSPNRSSFSGSPSIRCTQETQVKREKRLTDEDVKYTDHNKGQVDMENETMTAADPIYIDHAPIKVEVENETAHAPMNVKVNDKPAHAPIIAEVKEKHTHDQRHAAQARIKVEVDYDTALAQNIMDIEGETAHAPINFEANDETAHASINLQVNDETAHAPIKVEVNNETAHARTEVSAEVARRTSNFVAHAQDRVSDLNSKVNSNGFLYQDRQTKHLTCHLCPYISKTPSNNQLNFLLIHWASSHNIKKPHICKFCHLIFPSQELRLEHLQTSPHETCSFCSMQFETEDALGSHLKDLHHQDVNNSNNLTSTETETDEVWTWMHFQDRDTKQLICPICPEALIFPSVRRFAFLINHWKEVHHLSEPSTCRLCHAIFSTADLRSKHIQDFHKFCPLCSMEFSRVKSLNKHLKLFHDLAPTTLSPSDTSDFNAHLENEKRINLTCAICSTEFGKTKNLTRHLKRAHKSNSNSNSNATDTDESPPSKEMLRHKCTICSKKFRKATHLNYHINHTHNSNSDSTPSASEETPCKKAKLNSETPGSTPSVTSVENAHLENEQRLASHLTCPICSRKFIKSNFLNTHMRRIHNSNSTRRITTQNSPENKTLKRYKCNICSRKFRQENDLKNHFKSTQHSNSDLTPSESVALEIPCKKAKLNYASSETPTTTKQNAELSCSICSLKFGTEMHLQFHYEGHFGHPNPDPNEDVQVVTILPNKDAGHSTHSDSCQVCGRNFENEKKLEEHLIRAHYERKLGQSVTECVPCAPLVPVPAPVPVPNIEI